MDRRALTLLCLLLACGSADAGGPAASSEGGDEAVAPADPNLRRLIELAGSEGREGEALPLAQELRDELTEATEPRREAIADAMGRAVIAVEGTAGIANRLRIELLRGLGESEAEAARAPLTIIARRRRADQSFLFNRVALELLGERREEANIDVLIDGLFLCDAANPAMRMNDVAVVGLAQLGEAAVEPLLQVLSGRRPGVSELADDYVALVIARTGPGYAPTARHVMVSEALGALGFVGHPSALEPLLAKGRDDDAVVRLEAMMALASVRPRLDDSEPIRQAWMRIYADATDVQQQAHLLAIARRLADPALAPFLLEVAEESSVDPSLRLGAAHGYALIVPASDPAFGRLVRRNRDIRPQLTELAPLVAEADRCSELPCWIQAFQEHAAAVDAPLAEKAAMQIAQLGRGDPRAVSALVAKLGHRDMGVRLAALRALDLVATRGSAAAVQRIDELRESEEGRAIWNQFAREALPVRARLIARAR